jgi:iron complex outermembrane receptor protein
MVQIRGLRRVGLTAVVLLLLVVRLVVAQSPPPAETPASTELPPVRVWGTSPETDESVRDTSAFTTIIDTKDAPSRVQSVADVLAETVGVQVRRFGGLGAFSTISIRGSTPNQVDVYLDNILLNQANTGLVNLGNLPLENVERIEVYRGFAPLQLGAGSIGGAVNLVTRQIGTKPVTSASASYGSFDTRKVTLYRSQGFEKLGYLLLFNYAESENDFTFEDDNGTPLNSADDKRVKRTNNDFRSFTVDAKGEARLAGWDITLSDDFFTKTQGVPGQASVQSDDARLDVRRNVATLKLQRNGFPWSATDVTFRLAHTWQREAFKDLDGEIGLGSQDEKNTTNTFSANGLFNIYLDAWNQILGLLLDGQYETFRTVDELPERRGESADKGPLQKRTHVIAALQDEILLFDDRLALRPLLRYQFIDSDFGAQPMFGTVSLDQPRQEHEHLFSPSLGTQFRLTPFLHLKGNVGRFQRVPTFFELFGDRGVTLGNPELKSESSLNWDLGFTFELSHIGLLDRVFLEYAFFVSKADDLIVFVQNSQTTAQARNIGSADIWGHEVSWSLTAARHIRVYGNYTFQDTEDTSDTFSRGNTLPGRPRHELHQAVEFFATFGKFVYEFNYIADNFLDRANAFVVDSRDLHNLRVTALPFGKRLQLTFEVKNLTDNQVDDFRGFPLPGRAFFGTVTGQF